MSNVAIRSELEQKLLAWGAANTDVDVVLEGESYVRTEKPFVEAFLLPGNTLDVTVNGDRQRYVGIFQLNVHTSDDIGTGKVDRLAESLISHFPLLPKTGRVSVEKTPSAARAILSDGHMVVPVSIQYRYES